MKAKRILSLIMVIVMVCSMFLVSCGGKKDPNGGGAGAVIENENQDESKTYDAEIKNLNGHEFRFVVRHTSSAHLSVNEVYAEAPNGDKVNDAVFARNSQLADKYNCTIVEDRQTTPAAAVREPLIAGEYIADLMLATCQDMRPLAASNLLADMAVLENINLDKAWYDKNGMDGMNVGGKIFFVNGDGCTLDDRAAWIMFFNKDWIEEVDPTLNLYDVVEKGEWTIDLMYELMTKSAKDLDGDGVWTVGTDRFGYIGEAGNNWFHVNGCGVTLSRLSSAGEYEIPASPKPELLAVWEELRPILTSPLREVSWSGPHFKAGLGTFYACNLGTILNAGSSTISLGVLPLPKRNAEQDKYYNGVAYAQLGCFAIPTTTDNCEDWETNGFTSGREQAAYFLEAFSYYSMLTLTPAFYDQVILKQSIRDVESARMVELAMENKLYDPVVGYDFGKIKIFEEVGSSKEYGVPGTDANYDTFVSTYQSRYNAARQALKDYLEYINTEEV